jgi:hypothetical protein
MEKNPRLLRVQPYGLLVGDKVDFMAALRQFNAQFSAHNSAAAICGITGYANFHQGRSMLFSGLRRLIID